MRKFILLATLLMSTTLAYASHYSLGYVTYKWVGDSAFYGQNDYEIEIGVYRYLQGAAIGTGNLNVKVIEECTDVPQYINITYIPPTPNQEHPNDQDGRLINFDNNCTDSLTGQWSLYIYRKVITIGANNPCDQYKIVPYFPCCRDLKDNVASGSLGVYASLNRSKGPVSMPIPKHSEMISRFCINQEFTIGPLIGNPSAYSQALIPSVPLENDGTSVGSVTLDTLGYDSAYSLNQPLPIAAGTNYLINPSTRTVNFTPNLQGNYALAFNYNQFAFDTATSSQYLAGSMHFETVVIVSTQCDSILSKGPVLNFSNSTQQIARGCGLQTIDLSSNSPVDESSLDTNASEFRAVDPSGAPVPIIDAQLTDPQTINLSFYNPLQSNGRYQVYIKTGNDGNILRNSCGFESSALDTFYIDISGCSNVGLPSNPANKLSLYPNPAHNKVALDGAARFPVDAVQLSSIDGKINRSLQIESDHSLSLKSIPSGVYVLSISLKNSDQIERHRLVVQ